MKKFVSGLKQNWLLLLVFVIFSTAITFFVSYYIRWSTEKILTEVSNQLTTLGRMKSTQISLWKQERIVDGQTLQTDHSFSQSISLLLNDLNNLSLIQENQARLKALLLDPNYSSIILYDKDGNRIMRVGDLEDEPTAATKVSIRETSLSHEIMISDLYRAVDGSVKMDMLVPIFPVGQENESPIAFVDFSISPNALLYPLIQDLPDENLSSETLIVQAKGDEVLFLNNLRYTENAALNLSIPLTREDVPAVLAVLGVTGIEYGNDYRGVPVMAYITTVYGTDWKLIAKTDMDEIYEPIRRQNFFIYITVILMVVSSILIITYLWRLKTIQIARGLSDSENKRKSLEEKYLMLFNQANDAILLIQEDGKIFEVNDQALKLYGYTKEEFLTLTVADLRDVPTSGQIATDMERVKSGKTHYFETKHRKKNGDVFVVDVSSRFLELEGKGFFQSILRDATERIRVEEELRQSAEAFKKAQEVSKVGSWRWDRIKDKVYWSDEMFKIFNMPISKEGWDFTKIIKGYTHPDDYTRITKIANDALQAQQVYSFDVRLVLQDGIEKDIWVEAGELVLDEQQNIVSVSGIVQDITEKMKIEKELRKNENLLQRIFDLLPVGLWITDKDGNMIKSNKRIKEIWGKEILVGLGGMEIFHGRRLPSKEEIRADDWASVHTIKEGVTIRDEMIEIDSYDGQTKTILNYSTPIFNENGELEGSIISNLDITELRKAEEQLSTQLDELRRWNLATLGRETRVRELKVEINALLEELGKPPKYKSVKDESN